MIRVSCLLALLFLSGMSAGVHAKSPKPVRVAIETSAGRIVVALEMKRAPITATNFLNYAEQKRLDGTTFYRSANYKGGGQHGFIQGGIQHFVQRARLPIAHEPTSKTGLSHVDGTISMARGRPGTAMGDFFICVGALPYMDARPDAPGDNKGFAAFGYVVSGMDVVKRILNGRTLPKSGSGGMKGQMLAQPVRIITVRPIE